MKITQDLIDEILNKLRTLPDISSDEIPGIDLYMDQVTTFMEEHLAACKRSEDEKILTKTMINNYAKNKLLPPPEKKKYSKEHILILVFIYYYKNVLSLQDIRSILAPLTETYFPKSQSADLTALYDQIFSDREAWQSRIESDFLAYAAASADKFSDAPQTEKEDLQLFALISALCFDMYAKKKMIENLLDRQFSENAALSAGKPEEKAKKKK